MTHVEDIVSANIFCADNISNDDIWGNWYDVGSGNNISLNELKDIVKKYFPNQNFEYRSPRQGDVNFTKADLSKFERHGWKANVDLELGLKQVYARLFDENFS